MDEKNVGKKLLRKRTELRREMEMFIIDRKSGFECLVERRQDFFFLNLSELNYFVLSYDYYTFSYYYHTFSYDYNTTLYKFQEYRFFTPPLHFLLAPHMIDAGREW